MTTIHSLRDALIEELKDLYSAESQLLKALPKMEKKATDPDLKKAISSHLKETQGQLERLEEISTEMGVKLTGVTCKAMQGLIEEGKEALEEDTENDALLDAFIIGAARRVEHYEMAAYCTARAMAAELGESSIEKLLSETFDEESAADDALKGLLCDTILPEANVGEEDEEEDDSPPPPKRRNGNIAKAMMIGGLIVMGSFTEARADANRDNQVEKEATQHEVDNTGRNLRDQNESRKTASDQQLAGREIEILAQIRREMVANKDLSVNGQNVKVIVEPGVVTLRGPVASLGEKQWIEQTSARVAQGFRIIDQIEVAKN